jgi:toxin ParE1/3/4
LAHIQRDNPDAARRVRLRAERLLRRLSRYPASGRLIPEFPELPYREVVIPPYRFFYRVEAKVVWIVAVWHGAQLPGEPKLKGGV